MLDVRPGAEYTAGHIRGAISIPIHDLKSRLGEIPDGADVVAYCRGPYCASCGDDEFPGRIARFHGGVCLGNLVEVVHVIDGYDCVAGGDGVDELLQYSRGQITGFAAIGGQTYAVREVVDRVESHAPSTRWTASR